MKKLNYFQFGVILLSGFFCALLLLGNVSLLLGMKGAPKLPTDTSTDTSTIAKESAVAPSQQALSDIAAAKRQYTSADKTVQDAENPGGFTDAQRKTIETFKNKGQTGGLVEVRKQQLTALFGSKTQTPTATKTPLTQSTDQTASRTPTPITPPQPGLTPNRLDIALQPSNLPPQPFAKPGQLQDQQKLPTMQESGSNLQELSPTNVNVTNKLPDDQATPNMRQSQTGDDQSLNEMQKFSQTTNLDPMDRMKQQPDITPTDLKATKISSLSPSSDDSPTQQNSLTGTRYSSSSSSSTLTQISTNTDIKGQGQLSESEKDDSLSSKWININIPGSGSQPTMQNQKPDQGTIDDRSISLPLQNSGSLSGFKEDDSLSSKRINIYIPGSGSQPAGQRADGESTNQASPSQTALKTGIGTHGSSSSSSIAVPNNAGTVTGPAGQKTFSDATSQNTSLALSGNVAGTSPQQVRLSSSGIASSTAVSSSTGGQKPLQAVAQTDPQPSKYPPTEKQEVVPSKPKPFIPPLKLPARGDGPAPSVPPKNLTEANPVNPNIPPKPDDNPPEPKPDNNKTFMAIGGVVALGALVGGLVGGLTAGGDNQGGGGGSAAATTPAAPGQVVSVTPGPGQAPVENLFPGGAGAPDPQPAPTPVPVAVAPADTKKPKGFDDDTDQIGLLNEIASKTEIQKG